MDFFSEKVPARLARQLGTIIMTRAQSARHTMSLESYDRFFPNQDYHLALLSQAFDKKLSGQAVKAFTLVGGMGKKARASVLAEINAALESKTRIYIMATGSFVGEGFDLPALDTLIIAMPVSFKGKLIQYAGRLHRAFEGKRDALIYDYLDSASALTVSMFKKRASGYKMMGYRIEASEIGRAQRIIRGQASLFEGL